MKRLFRNKSKRDRNGGDRPSLVEYDDDEPIDSTSPVPSSQPAQSPLEQSAPPPRRKFTAPPASRTYRGPNNAQVTDVVGWLCGVGRDDWATVLRLCDDISTSQDLAKEAARALRKELEHGQPEPQQRAARLLVIMSRNGGDRFRLQLAEKRFVDAVEKTLKSSKTNPDVRNMLLKAFSVLAYENQRDRDLVPIVALYNRTKRPEDPVNGNESDAEDPIFSPQEVPRRHQYRGSPQSAPPNLWNEAQLAKSNAGMLSEALSFTKPEDLDNNELVQEFYAKCQESQAHLVDAIPMATSAADAARSRQPPVPEGVEEGRTVLPLQEEELLSALLTANQELIDVFRMHDDMSRQRRQALEEQEVQQRSLVETRHDRNAAAALQVPQTGPFASGSSENLAATSHGSSSRYSNADLEDDRTRSASPYASSQHQSSYPAARSASPQSHLSQSPPLSGYGSTNMISPTNMPAALPRTNPYAATTARSPPINPFTRAPLPPGAGAHISPSQQATPNGQRSLSPEPYLGSSLVAEEPEAASDLAQFPSSNPYRSPPRSSSGASFPSIGGGGSTNPYISSPQRTIRSSTGSMSSSTTNPYLAKLAALNPAPASSSLTASNNGGGSATPTREGSVNGTDEEPSTPLEPSAKALGKLRRFSMRDDGAMGDPDAERQQNALEEALRQRYLENAAQKRASAALMQTGGGSGASEQRQSLFE